MNDVPEIDFDAFARRLPEAVTALRTLSRLATQEMDKALVELIKVRASQINGCAYCLQLHLNWARKAGVALGKLDQVVLWRESDAFTPQERAALAWAEALTACAGPDERGAIRERLRGQFSEAQILHLTVAVAAINAWNRVAGPLGFTAPRAE